jgi:hypothetical protein
MSITNDKKHIKIDKNCLIFLEKVVFKWFWGVHGYYFAVIFCGDFFELLTVSIRSEGS